jgi:hypothetical protein
VPSLADLITDRLQPALAALLTAFDYAADSGADRWEFAVEITELLREPSGTVPFCGASGAKGDCPLLRGRFSDQRPALGATIADLRWLIRRGLAEHAKETTTPGDPARTFRPLAATSFPADSCYVLTPLGADTLRPFIAGRRLSPSPFAGREPVERTGEGQPAVSLPNGGEGAVGSQQSEAVSQGSGNGQNGAQNGANLVSRSPDRDLNPNPESLAPSP